MSWPAIYGGAAHTPFEGACRVSAAPLILRIQVLYSTPRASQAPSPALMVSGASADRRLYWRRRIRDHGVFRRIEVFVIESGGRSGRLAKHSAKASAIPHSQEPQSEQSEEHTSELQSLTN